MKSVKPENKVKKEWIEKDKKRMVPKLSKKVIYVPSLNELTF
jgi:hypothetical protein